MRNIQETYGAYFPDRDGVMVSVKGDQLLSLLANLDKYQVGGLVTVGKTPLRIEEVISIDGRKMVFEDGSWLMIRPSGTEPKVRFYVESRTKDGTAALVLAAQKMFTEIGIL